MCRGITNKLPNLSPTSNTHFSVNFARLHQDAICSHFIPKFDVTKNELLLKNLLFEDLRNMRKIHHLFRCSSQREMSILPQCNYQPMRRQLFLNHLLTFFFSRIEGTQCKRSPFSKNECFCQLLCTTSVIQPYVYHVGQFTSSIQMSADEDQLYHASHKIELTE